MRQATYDKKNSSAVDEVTLQALVDDPLRGVNIERSENVVEEQDFCLRVHCTSQGDTSLEPTLALRQV